MSNARLFPFLHRPALTVVGTGALAIMTMERALDPVFLWFAPLAIPAAIWLQARCEWVATMRSIGAVIAQPSPTPERLARSARAGARNAPLPPRKRAVAH